MDRLRSLIPALILLGACGPEPVPQPPIDTGPFDTGTPLQQLTWTYEENKVDVLILVDNNPNMTPIWDDVLGLVDGVMDGLMGTPAEWIWHVGIVTMDMENGDYQGQLQEVDGYRFIPRYAPSPDILAGDLMDNMALDGGTPRARDAANAALVDLAKGVNTEFYREDAALLVLYISNDSDYSTLEDTAWQDWLENAKWHNNPVRVYGALSTEPPCPTAIGGAPDWSALATATGGETWSICNGGFPDLATMMEVDAQAWPGSLRVPGDPDPSTLSLRWELQEQVRSLSEGTDWVWNDATSSVDFEAYGPPDEIGTHIVVNYLPL